MVRSSSVDTLKVILFLLVVLGHINTPFHNYIYAFHMPAFFFLSGFLMKNMRLDSTQKDFINLIVPFLIFSILGICIELIKRIVLGREFPDFYRMLHGIYISFDSTVSYYGFVLWFLPVLFLVKILARVIINRINSRLILFILSSCTLYFFKDFNFSLPFFLGINKVIITLPFFIFGYLYKGVHARNGFLTISLSLIISLSIIYFFSTPYFDIGSSRVDYDGVSIFFPVFLVTMLLALLGVLERYFDINSEYIQLLASFSMLFFVFHPYTNNISHLITLSFGVDFWLWKFILSIVLLLIICFFKKRKSNWIVFKYV
ncbi:acyltransferase family protein [Vibrio metschnikovii]|uniref:Acyltransferase family protein n=1 Tax=bacterium 19CA03SA04 TaxID=2920698 RepID=A0AAU6SXR6_UNCXX|nr:acyltransferase family protein [Vibrio metschnikovii]